MLQAFFEVNISMLPLRFLSASTACIATVNDTGLMGLSETAQSGCWKEIIKIKVRDIFDPFLFHFVANMYGYIFPSGHRDIQPLSNYLVAG